MSAPLPYSVSMALLAGKCKANAETAMQTARRTLDPYNRKVWMQTARSHHRNYLACMRDVRSLLQGEARR